MPTNVELAKRLDMLEGLFQGKIAEVLEDVTSKVKASLMADTGPVVVEELKKEIEEFRRSLTFMDGTVERLTKERDQLRAANKAMAVRNEELERRVSELEQYSRKNNIEVKGIPCTKGESCLAIIQEIGNKIECPINESDIDIVHRVPSSSDAKHIIARFCSRAKKADFVSKARKARLQTSNIGFPANDASPLYVNEHLTQENKRLFAKSLSLKRENNWQFLWTDDCVIKARKTTDSKVFRIRNETDLAVFTAQ